MFNFIDTEQLLSEISCCSLFGLAGTGLLDGLLDGLLGDLLGGSGLLHGLLGDLLGGGLLGDFSSFLGNACYRKIRLGMEGQG